MNDYTGTMAIGYDATTFGEITSLDDLLDPKFKGVVALNGNPTEAGAAFNGVLMTSLAKGGSLSDIGPGIDFWVKVKEAGTFSTGDVTANTVTTGASAVVLDWSYNQVSYVRQPEGGGHRLEALRPGRARARLASTTRRSTSTPRTRPPPGCGRSTCTAPTRRTSGSRAAPPRCCRKR